MRAVLGMMAGVLLVAADAPPDWAARLRQDAQAMHDAVADSHPGPYNRLDPGFARRNDAGLALALRRAAQVRDYGGYLAAMRGYVASFDDGHVQFGPVDPAPAPLPLHWPGFLTGFDGSGAQVVRTVADGVALPLGARLVGCDGVPAERLAARNVGAFRGRWQLASQRAIQGGRLFVDNGNPFVPRPVRCSFTVAGKVQEIALQWRPLSDAEFDRRFAETAPRARPAFEARTLADGTRWYTMPSFDGDPDGAPAKALVPMIAAMKRDRAVVAAAPRIVLDLRGNGGGSSDWSRQVAVILWGQAAVAAADAGSSYVEWRASAANLAAMRAYQDKWRTAADVSPEAKAWVARITAGMAAARAQGAPLWREPDEAPLAPEKHAAMEPVAPPRARVFVLTDWGCGSACLDAVDLWTALGGVQVGQETSADSLYMDIRDMTLPSGASRFLVPMKVYRGRKRGSNVPAVPRHRYTGDMRDTAALERWIATL